MKKYAVLAMDLEDWYHLDYFDKNKCDQSESTLDGINIYLEILEEYKIKTTFFVVGELMDQLKPVLKNIHEKGHELGIHSYNHVRPLLMSLEEFEYDTKKAVEKLESIIGNKSFGYRAPCFSLNRERLDILKKLDFSYDTSKINFQNHPLYGDIDLSDFQLLEPWIYKKDDFVEFEVSTSKFLGKNIPISGGGYLRIFPWFFMKYLLSKYLRENKYYFFYIHPFELSENTSITFPPNTSISKKYRFSIGRKSVKQKIKKTIELLHSEGFEIITFSELKKNFVSS